MSVGLVLQPPLEVMLAFGLFLVLVTTASIGWVTLLAGQSGSVINVANEAQLQASSLTIRSTGTRRRYNASP